MTPSGVFASAGGRRFTLTLLVVVLTYLSLWVGKMSDSIVRDIIIGVAVVYVSGNVVQKIKAPAAEEHGG